MPFTSSARGALLLFIGAAAALAVRPGHARGSFALVDTTPVNYGLWLTRENQHWDFSVGTGWAVHNDQFQFQSVTGVPGTVEVRGIDYDPVNNLMVMADYGANMLRRATLGGALVSSVDTGIDKVNGVSVDPRDGTVWLSRFSGVVEHYSAANAPLSSFNAGFTLTGIAIDPVHDTLLLMRADGPAGVGGPLDDQVYEFNLAGENLGLRLDGSLIPGNGVSLEYLPDLGQLFAVSQDPQNVYEFQDRTRIPEPAGAATVTLLILASGATMGRRPRAN